MAYVFRNRNGTMVLSGEGNSGSRFGSCLYLRAEPPSAGAHPRHSHPSRRVGNSAYIWGIQLIYRITFLLRMPLQKKACEVWRRRRHLPGARATPPRHLISCDPRHPHKDGLVHFLVNVALFAFLQVLAYPGLIFAGGSDCPDPLKLSVKAN